ncbi:TsJ5 [Trichuris trichiura]|uniref:TsJ5 n=1 Tax=Trichuris trichiura TaxID=36087 RepID=A0A077YWH9_TRITR|nr:TsJ5 [Trichuris trichiura]
MGDTRVARGGNPRRGGGFGGPDSRGRTNGKSGFGPKGGDGGSTFGGGPGGGRGDFRGKRGNFQGRGGMKIRGGGENRGDLSRGKRRASFSNKGSSFGHANQGMERGFNDGKSGSFRGERGGKRHVYDEGATNKKRKLTSELEAEEEDVELTAEELSDASSLDDSDLEDEESMELDLSDEEMPSEGVAGNDQGAGSGLGTNLVSTCTPLQPLSLDSDEQETLTKMQAKKGGTMKKKEKQKGQAKPAVPTKMEGKRSKLAEKSAAKEAGQAKGTILLFSISWRPFYALSNELLMKDVHYRTTILATLKMTPSKKVAAKSSAMVTFFWKFLTDEDSDDSDLVDEDISDEIDLDSEELSEEIAEKDEQSDEEMQDLPSKSKQEKPSKKSAKTQREKVTPSTPAQAGKPTKGVLKKAGKDEVNKKPAKLQSQKPASTKEIQQELETVEQDEKVLAEELGRLKRRDACRLFINHLPRDVTVEDIKATVPKVLELFKPFRQDAKYGFLIFPDEETTMKQYAKLKDNFKIKDKEVVVDYCGQKSAKGRKELSPLIYKLQLFISDLPAHVSNEQIRELFPKAKHVEVMTRSRYGLVTFSTPEETREAFNSGSSMSLNDVPITVLYSRPLKAREKQTATKQTKQKAAKKKIDKLDKSVRETQSATSVKPSQKEETPKKINKKATKSPSKTSVSFADMKSDEDDNDGVESDDDDLDLDDNDDDVEEDFGADEDDIEEDDDDDDDEEEECD